MKNIKESKRDYIIFVCDFYKSIGISQKKLCKYIELSPGFMSRMRNSNEGISDNTIDRIQRITKIPFSEVFKNKIINEKI